MTKILQRIGSTPITELSSISDAAVSIFAKLESHNPFGSVKDRAAYQMIKDAENNGLIRRGKTIIIEATSGNTGIAVAAIGALLGYKVEIAVPENITPEIKAILSNLAAKLYITPGTTTKMSISLAKGLVQSKKDVYYMLNQFENESHFIAHYRTTGPEIWRQTHGKLTHLIVGCGTGGTITVIGTFLKEKNPNIQVIAVQPQKRHLIHGLRNFEESSIPEIYSRRYNVVDDTIIISNEEAFEAVRFLADNDNLFVGPSSGAVMAAVFKVANNLHEGVILGLFADDGRKYLQLYSECGVFEKERCHILIKSARDLCTPAFDLSEMND
jgi:S-sulfo-L-cysteine synthase (O-acetyl-L-serine-dependent)